MNELGVDADEAGQIAAAVQTEHRPRNLAGYLRKLAHSGDLADWQAGRRHARVAAEHRHTRPWCPHGEPGGADARPRTGRPWCPLCRVGIIADVDLTPARTGP
jgi:hypothetical protein